MSDLTSRNYVHSSPAIVNSKYSLNKSESDLVFMLLSQIDKDDKGFKTYRFTKSELELHLGVKIDGTQLYNTAYSLMQKPLSIKEDAQKWKIFSWFSKFSYDNGLIECGFHEDLLPYLLELGQFILADNRHLLKMKSDYSRRIYMLLKERYKHGVRKFNVEELQELLEVPKSYKIYNNFKQKVLFKAIKEINKFSDIKVELTERKINRKVTEITFSIKKNDEDLKQFISWIRELYTNEPLYASKDGRMLKCSDKGLLYYSDDAMEWLDEKTAQKSWEWLHQNREKLECFKPKLPGLE